MKLNIAYACDNNYISHTGISLLSLLENNQTFAEISIFVISVGISSENIVHLQNIVDDYKRKLIVIPFEILCPDLKLSNVGRHIETVYAKLFFGNLQECDKIIYLDSDTIIKSSLEEMWSIDLEDNYFGLVKTVTKDYSEMLGLPTTEVFYNDGIAIVNASKLRKDNMQKEFLKFIESYNGNPPVLSEGTINVVCKNKIKTIHPKFNFGSSFFMLKNKELNVISNEEEYYPEHVLNEARKNPVVIHYLAGWFKRPWEIGCTHPLKHEYLNYKKKTIWKDDELIAKKLPLKFAFLKLLSALLPSRVLKVIISLFNKIKKPRHHLVKRIS